MEAEDDLESLFSLSPPPESWDTRQCTATSGLWGPGRSTYMLSLPVWTTYSAWDKAFEENQSICMKNIKMGKLLFCWYSCLSEEYKCIPSLTCIHGNHSIPKHLYTKTHMWDLMLLESVESAVAINVDPSEFCQWSKRLWGFNYTLEEHSYFIEIGL